jgi:rod shape-determining protein MreD
MISELGSHIIRFVILVMLQVLVLNNIQFGGFVNPFLYVLVLMLLPFNINKTIVLIIAFITGLTIDIFTGTLGLHASACVFLGFFRPKVLDLIQPREGYEFGKTPSISDMGLVWFLTYTSIVVVLHHLWLFLVENWSFSELHYTLFRMICSSVMTIVLIVLLQFIFSPSKSRK